MLQVYLALLDTQGDRDKFIQIYEKYRDLMFYTALQYLDSDADREIAVDVALHCAVDIIGSIDDPLSIRTKHLMVLITKRKCIDLLRKKRGVQETEWDECAKERKTASAGAAGSSAQEELSEAIASMSETGKEMILLRYYHGYSAAEIAKILGIGRDASRKRLERAKAELKAILEE